MTYRYVQSAVDLGRARGPRLALCVHMAQGGGTVEFLSKPNPDGVSVHFVIRYTGEIVQMLAEDHMHSSLRTTAIRRDDDADGFYGRTAALAVLGKWADVRTTLGPNHATLAVEIEGFAADGPNVKQAASLARLVGDLRTRYPSLALLGHRDFQSYKACPGHLIAWDALGGHGPQEEPLPQSFDYTPDATAGSLTVNGPGHWYLALSDGKLHGPIDPATFGTKRAFGPVIPKPEIPGHPGAPAYLIGDGAALILVADSTFIADKPDAVRLKEAVNGALDHVASALPAVTTAIDEARIR